MNASGFTKKLPAGESARDVVLPDVVSGIPDLQFPVFGLQLTGYLRARLSSLLLRHRSTLLRRPQSRMADRSGSP